MLFIRYNAFGAPRRASTTTPLQALTMLNHGFAIDVAHAFADRLRRDAGALPEDEIGRAFALAFGRPPTAEEAADALRLINQHGFTAFCRAILNTNEMISLD